jgi:ribokinase
MTAKPVILCAGSLHHDVIVDAPSLPRLDQTLAGSAVRYAFGGKGGNQAIAAARAGAEVHMAGAVGSDDLAIILRHALDEAGVRRGMVQTHPGPTGMSVAIALPDGSYGAVIVSGANLLLRPEVVSLPKDCALLMLQSEIAEAANLAVARRAREAGVRVVLNAAPARVVSDELLGLLDLRAASALLALGPKAVIVTLGGDGLVLAEGGTINHHPAQPVRVVSSHGAGDAFIGALAAEWARGATLAKATRFGQAAAALHVSAPVPERAAVAEAAIRALV